MSNFNPLEEWFDNYTIENETLRVEYNAYAMEGPWPGDYAPERKETLLVLLYGLLDCQIVTNDDDVSELVHQPSGCKVRLTLYDRYVHVAAYRDTEEAFL